MNTPTSGAIDWTAVPIVRWGAKIQKDPTQPGTIWAGTSLACPRGRVATPLRGACGADLDWPEIALRFALSVPGVHTAIVGTTSPANARANLAAAARGPLPAAAVDMIRRAYRAADPGGAWPGLT